MSDDEAAPGAAESDEASNADGADDAGRGPSDEIDEFRRGIRSSSGDPRLLIAMNLILSALFAWTVVAGLSLLGAMELSAFNVATLAIVLFAMTYVITRP